MGFWARAAQLVRPVAVAQPEAGAQPAASRPEPAWPSLPVIQRVVTPTTPVADRAPFVASLRSHQNPSFLAPLAHLIDPDGPGGRIGGLVSPAATVQRTPEQEPGLVHQWPQRVDDGPVLRPAPLPVPSVSLPGPQFSRAPESVAQRSVDDGGSSAAPTGTPDAVLGADALRHLTAHDAPMPVQRSLTAAAVSEPALRTLPAVATAASEDVAPRPRAVATEPVTAQRDGPDAAPPDVAIARVEDVAEAAPPVQRFVAADASSGDGIGHGVPEAPSRPDPHTPVQRAVQLPSPNAAVPTVPERPPVDQVVGHAPAPQPAASRHVQRTPAPAPSTPTSSRPDASTPFPATSTPAADSPAANSPAANSPAANSAAASETVASAPLVGATAQRPAPQHIAPQHTTAQRTPVQAATAQRTPAPTSSIAGTPRASAPLAGTSPTSVQRAPSERAQGGAVRTTPPASPPQAPSVQRVGAAAPTRLGLGAPLEHAPAPASRIETVSLQEWAAARAQPPTMQRSATAPEPIGPQAGATAKLPAEPAADTPVPASTSHIAFAAATGVPTANPPVAQRFVGEAPQIAMRTVAPPVGLESTPPQAPTAEPRRTTMPDPTGTPRVQRLVHPDAAAAARTQDAGSIAVAAGIAHRDADGTVVFGASAPEAVVQRAVDTSGMTVDTAAPSPVTTATAAPQAPTAAGAPNLDDLARRLYDPLAARLKAELRLDRERFGLITDVNR